MKNSRKLLEEITKLTKEIETNYPELYEHLGENPMTIPDESDPEINNKVLEKYLESLRQLLKNHIETRKIV